MSGYTNQPMFSFIRLHVKLVISVVDEY